LRGFSDVEGFGDDKSAFEAERVAWSLESSEDKHSVVKGSVAESGHSWSFDDSSLLSDTENYDIKLLLTTLWVAFAPFDSLKWLHFCELQAPAVLMEDHASIPLKLLTFLVAPPSKHSTVVFLML